MKKNILIFITLLNITVLLGQQELKLDGIYQKENIYIFNPFQPSGTGYCVIEVLVNGKTTTDEISSNAFEIDLGIYNFKIGDPVTVIIKHRDGCKPQILNPEVLMPKSTFTISSINIDKNGVLTWKTTGEVGSLPFIVEQFKWNKWVTVATINGVGKPNQNEYSVNIHFITGINRIRVKQVDYSKKPRYSQEVSFNNTNAPITFKPGNGQKTSKEIVFSASTDYEIYDYFGQLVTKGYGTKIDVSKYKVGTYFINYDNKSEYFEKK